MSGTRFARTGRCRFYICLGLLVIIVSVVAIFQSSQQQLEETREQRIRCEQQQEALNERVKNVVEQKFESEKGHERELQDQMEMRRNLEQQLRELKEANNKELMDGRLRYEKLQQSFEILKSEHNDLKTECTKIRKRNLEDRNGMEKKLQIMRSEIENEKKALSEELNAYEKRIEVITKEKDRLERLVSVATEKSQMQKRIVDLERILDDYGKHCEYKSPLTEQQQINKPLNLTVGENKTSTSGPHVFDKPHVDKSFNEQNVVSPGIYHIAVNLTNLNTTTNNTLITTADTEANGGGGIAKAAAVTLNLKKIQHLLPYSARNNRSLIINSVENFQILPKPMRKVSEEAEAQLKQLPGDNFVPAPPQDVIAGKEKSLQKQLSTEKEDNGHAALNGHLKPASNATSTSTNSNLLPLPLPPNQQPQQPRKLPENVAPIPANFDDLLKNDASNQKETNNKPEQAADVNAAIEEIAKNENDAANNRYANVVNDLQNNAQKQAPNEDSGAHEIKDHDLMNEQNFNLPAEDDTNFFEAGAKNDAGADEKRKVQDNDEDDMMGADAAGGNGDIAVKNHNHLLDNDDLNNEVAGDQGIHGDGLHLEEGNAEEDEDEDDYSNPAARQQGAQAIRN